MFDKSRIQKDFSKVASQYDEHAVLQQRILQNLVEKAKPLLHQQGTILDAGCGTGQLATFLPGYAFTGADIAYAMCTSARSKGITAVNASIESLPFASGSFDAVFSSLALQWVGHWQEAIAEMERVIKPGGLLAISTFGDGTLAELKESFTCGDRYPHVSEFMPADAFDHSETVTEFFPDLRTLMRSLKAIGAGNKLMMRSKSLMTAWQLQAVEKYYQKHFATENGLPVTWKVLYSVRKL